MCDLAAILLTSSNYVRCSRPALPGRRNPSRTATERRGYSVRHDC